MQDRTVRLIRNAVKHLPVRELYDYIMVLCESDEALLEAIDTSEVTTVIGFASDLVNRMRGELNKYEWPSFEIRCLKALDEMDVSEEDFIFIDAYGYPQPIKDNAELLEIIGLGKILGCEMNKKQYRIPLVWEMYGLVTVEAESEQEAIKIALGPDCPLPEGNYVDDSIKVDDITEIEVF